MPSTIRNDNDDNNNDNNNDNKNNSNNSNTNNDMIDVYNRSIKYINNPIIPVIGCIFHDVFVENCIYIDI